MGREHTCKKNLILSIIAALNISWPIAAADDRVEESPGGAFPESLSSVVAEDETTAVTFVRSQRPVRHILAIHWAVRVPWPVAVAYICGLILIRS